MLHTTVRCAASHRRRHPSDRGLPGALLAAPILLALSAPAHAGRPLHADDAGLIPRGACQLEFWRAWSREEQRWTASPGCTVYAGAELSLLYAHVEDDRERGVRVRGGQLKLALGEAGTLWPAVAVALATERDRRIHPGGVFDGELLLNAIASWENSAANRALHLNLGAQQSAGDRRAWSRTWALAVEAQAAGGLWFGLESFGRSDERGRWQVGLRQVLSEHLQLDAGHGAEWGRYAGTRQSSLGLVWLTPPWF